MPPETAITHFPCGLFLHVSRYHTTFAKDVVIFSLRTIKGVPGSLDGRSWCFFVRDSDSLSSIACSCEPQRAPDGIIEQIQWVLDVLGASRLPMRLLYGHASLWKEEPKERLARRAPGAGERKAQELFMERADRAAPTHRSP